MVLEVRLVAPEVVRLIRAVLLDITRVQLLLVVRVHVTAQARLVLERRRALRALERAIS